MSGEDDCPSCARRSPVGIDGERSSVWKVDYEIHGNTIRICTST